MRFLELKNYFSHIYFYSNVCDIHLVCKKLCPVHEID